MPQVLKTINSICFILAAGSVMLAAANYALRSLHDRQGKVKSIVPLRFVPLREHELNERCRKAVLGAILLLAVAIRVWQFGLVPGGINQDGAMAAVDAKALADYKTDRFGTFMPAHLNAWGFGQMSSLLSYLIAIFVKCWGLSVITARLPQLIVSMAGGIFFYLFMKDLFGKKAGLAAALFVAVNPWHFLQSRWALDCNLLPHFFMAAMYFLNRGLRGQTLSSRVCTYASMVFFGLCMYCYGITIYTIPPLLVAISVYYVIKKRLRVRDVLICAGVYLLIAWPFLLTMAVNFFKWDTISLPFVTIQYFPHSVRSKDILLFSEEPLHQFVKNVHALLNVTLLQKKDLNWNDIRGFGTMYLCTMPFVFAGIIEFIRRRSEGAKGLAVFMVLAGIWAGLLTNNVNINRANLIYYGMMIFAVLGIVFTIREIRLFLWSNLAMYAVLAVMLVMTYFGSYADMIKNNFFYGFGDALLRAEEAGTQKIYITSHTMYKNSYHVSEILTLFYDETDARYFQGITNVDKGQEKLAYNQRFVYTSIDMELVQSAMGEDAAFVIRSEEAGYFMTNEYEVIPYGTYSAVVPKD